MNRSQIHLTDDEARALEREARASGRSKSQLIRDAIDQVYLGGTEPDEILRRLERSAGAWRRRESGAQYVERLRSGRLPRIRSR